MIKIQLVLAYNFKKNFFDEFNIPYPDLEPPINIIWQFNSHSDLIQTSYSFTNSQEISDIWRKIIVLHILYPRLLSFAKEIEDPDFVDFIKDNF